MLKDASWPWDTEQEKPMQTAAGRRKSSMPESVTGTNNVQRTHALTDRAIDRESDKAFAPDEREWTDAELANIEKWRSSLIGRLVDYYA
jgi:hypothetical protein